MIVMKKLLLALTIAVTLSGCYTMVNRQNPNANFQYDNAQCANEAMSKVPAVVPAPRTPTYTTNCSKFGNDVTCTTVPTGGGSDDAIAQTVTYNRRAAYTNNCMRMKGWNPESRR